MRIRKVFLCLTLSLIACYSFCNDIIVKYDDGRAFSSKTALLKDDVCIFSLKDGGKANWKLRFDTDAFIVGKQEVKLDNAEVFNFCPRKCDANWLVMTRHILPNDSSTYYKAMLICEQGTYKDSVAILLNMCPSKPKLLDSDFTYNGFDFDEFYFTGAKFTFTVSSERCKSLHAEGAHWYFWGGNDYFDEILEILFPEQVKVDDTTFFLQTPPYENLFGLKEQIFFVASNEYGYSQNSDTLLVSDYIKDEELLDKIKETLNIDQVSTEATHLEGRNLLVGDAVKKVMIFNGHGQMVMESNNCGSINLSKLPKGVYLITTVTKTNKKVTKKYVL